MKTKFLFLTAIFGLAAACVTNAPVTQTSTVESKLQEKAKVYKTSVHSVAEGDIKPGQCYKNVTKVKALWNWKDAVDAANSCMRAKDYQHVEEIGNDLALREPGAAWGPYYLGLAARESGNLERALWMAELALKRAPDLSVLHYFKAQILWEKKDYKTAVDSFEQAVQLDDNNMPAHLFLGQVYFRDQDFSRASKHFYSVLKVDPRHAIALSGLAESQLHENNPQGALDAYTRLAEAYPRDGQYLSRMGEIYESVLNDIPNALGMYRQLQAGVRSGKITKNLDPENDSKVKELEVAMKDTRSMASNGAAVTNNGAAPEKRKASP